jgi:hypothetical protein
MLPVHETEVIPGVPAKLASLILFLIESEEVSSRVVDWILRSRGDLLLASFH